MGTLLATNEAQLVLWCALLLGMLFVAWYVIERTRTRALQQERDSAELLTKFREIHSRGELTDEEFRTIKTTLAEQLQDELKDTGDKG